MLTSTRLFQNLPPKQALALLLQEKARRRKSRPLMPGEVLHPPIDRSATSLVMMEGHPLHDLIHRRSRLKVFWGGRGSSKSWGVVEALVRLVAKNKLRVLCTREFQNSIKDSSHKLLGDTIRRLGLSAWFDITRDNITSRSGGEFLFKGLHNNDNSIRSTEGIDICWVEEGHSVSNNSWRVLLPTIRKDNVQWDGTVGSSEIWVTFNLEDESNPVYKLFVEKIRKNSIVHKINYDSNPFFPESLRQEMEADKERDYQLYEHVWLGLPLKVTDAIIFNRKYRVAAFDDDLWRKAERPFYGLDFGFAQDPAALIRSFPIERDYDGKRRLYISHEAYDTGVELDDMAEWMKSVPGVRDWPIHADSSRPETISFLRKRGFAVAAAEKWEGCVEDGITHLRNFDEIVIHDRCVNMAREARLYRYKTDPRQLDDHGQPVILPIIIQKNDHTWDALRYSYDGYIMRSGDLGLWSRLAN